MEVFPLENQGAERRRSVDVAAARDREAARGHVSPARPPCPHRGMRSWLRQARRGAEKPGISTDFNGKSEVFKAKATFWGRCPPVLPSGSAFFGRFMVSEVRGAPCMICPEGTWSAAGDSECQRCPAGTWSGRRGQSSAETCVKCPMGSWSSQVGAISPQAPLRFEGRRCRGLPELPPGALEQRHGPGGHQRLQPLPRGHLERPGGRHERRDLRALRPGSLEPPNGRRLRKGREARNRCIEIK